MRIKQILASIAIIVFILLIVYPTFATGTITFQLNAEITSDQFDHLYVTVREVSVHKAKMQVKEGWITILNETRSLDLATLKDVGDLIAESRLMIGEYDKVKLTFTNASTVVNNTQLKLDIDLAEYVIPVEFLSRASQETRILLEANARVKKVAASGILYLTFTAKVI